MQASFGLGASGSNSTNVRLPGQQSVSPVGIRPSCAAAGGAASVLCRTPLRPDARPAPGFPRADRRAPLGAGERRGPFPLGAARRERPRNRRTARARSPRVGWRPLQPALDRIDAVAPGPDRRLRRAEAHPRSRPATALTPFSRPAIATRRRVEAQPRPFRRRATRVERVAGRRPAAAARTRAAPVEESGTGASAPSAGSASSRCTEAHDTSVSFLALIPVGRRGSAAKAGLASRGQRLRNAVS
jgi:hypothetical protein